jgi:hypothetical protein
VRATAALPLLILTPLCACAPDPSTLPDPAIALDCHLPFEAQRDKLTAQAGLVASPHDVNEPYRFYSTPHGRVSYLVTEPGAPGHPAIFMETARHDGVDITGCPYGDAKGYAKIQAYLESLRGSDRPKRPAHEMKAPQ